MLMRFWLFRKFQKYIKMECRCATVCQLCFSLLCRCRSICSKDMMLDKDNPHLLGDSCWFNYIPCCSSSF